MRRRVIGLLVAVLMGSGLSLGVPSAAPATSTRPMFGVNFHAMWSSYTDTERLAVLDKLAAAGVQWVRIDMGWSSFEGSCQGCFAQWYLNRANLVVDAARARGIQVLVMLHRTPAWANGGQDVNVPPTNPDDFGPFAKWIADQFRGRVAAWQVWNEPNLSGFWTGTGSDYAALLKVAYPAIKAADPDAKVVIGGPALNNDPWLAQVYAAGANKFFDVMATQPYQVPSDLEPETPDTTGTNIGLIAHVPAVLNLMKLYGDGGKEIWFTEFGWSSHTNTGSESKYRRGVTEAQQADYLVRALEFVGANYPYVTNVFWYEERNNDSSYTDPTKKIHMDNFGLLYRDLSPKPAYEALKNSLVGGGSGGGGDDGKSGGGGSGKGGKGKPKKIVGTSGPDVLIGTPGNDIIIGKGGKDIIRGRGGDDILKGGAGEDKLYGGPGADKLYGGKKFDRLDSVDGVGSNDFLAGGGGGANCFTDKGDSRLGCK